MMEGREDSVLSRDSQKDLAALLEAHAKEIEEAEQALLEKEERKSANGAPAGRKHRRLASIRSNIDELLANIENKPATPHPSHTTPRRRRRVR